MKTHPSNEKTHDKDKDDKDEDVDDVHENNTEVYSEFVFPPRAWIQVVWLNFQISVSMGPDPERAKTSSPGHRTSEGNSRTPNGGRARLAQRSIRVITWKNVRAGNVVNDVFGDVVICGQNIGPISFTSYINNTTTSLAATMEESFRDAIPKMFQG